MLTFEGTIEIPMEDFWVFVRGYLPKDKIADVCFGPPKVNKGNQTLEIKVAATTSEDTPVDSWHEESLASREWRYIV